ncbi:MAG TPA: hypothetical protein VHI97_00330 [Actinomycetota bacterium]|nr:hypothetical protein [Actinomycetota bacterium]
MGQSADQTVRQIEEARERLGTEIQEFEDRLQDRLPTARRAVLPIAGAVVATGAALLVVRGVRQRAKAKAAAQRFPARIIGRVLPARAGKPKSKTSEDERWKLWVLAAGVGGVWTAVRLAELGQLRRLNRTLAVK